MLLTNNDERRLLKYLAQRRGKISESSSTLDEEYEQYPLRSIEELMKAGAELDKEVLDISSSDKITKTHTDKLQILLEERSAAKSQTFSQLAETKDSVIKLIKGKENPSIITRFGELLSDPSMQ